MKIAICINQSSLGGVGTSTYILAMGLRAAGHQADILVTDKDPGADYARARHDGWPVQAICEGQLWLRERLRTVQLHLGNYDVVLNNNSYETMLILPCLSARTVRLSVVRSTDATVIEDACTRSPYLDAVVGISPAVTDLLLARGIGCATHTIPNAVLVKNDQIPVLSRPVKIIFVGRLEDRQKHVLLLPAFADCLRRRMQDFHIEVVGDGPDRGRLEREILAHGVEQYVSLRGGLPRERSWQLLCESHFALIPSRFEGFGLTLAESMAAGAVPVARDIPVFRWILGTDADAVLVSGEDPEEYVERLISLSSDLALYSGVQQRLRDRQRACFTPEKTVSKYRKLIETLHANRDVKPSVAVALKDLHLPTSAGMRCSYPWYLLQVLKRSLKGSKS